MVVIHISVNGHVHEMLVLVVWPIFFSLILTDV